MGIIAWTKLTAAWVLTSAAVKKAEQRQWGLEAEAVMNAAISRTPLMNGAIVASVAGNVLTVAVKRLDGSDPASGVNSVYADLRHATQNNGQSTLRAITAALSATLSGGSTAGFANGVPGRLWIGLFDDAGTQRLGFFNAYGGNTAGATGSIFAIVPSLLTSSTAEGGVGAADSAGVWYTGTAVTSKPLLILGYLDWETPLATAGNWSATPDIVHQQRWGDPLPNDIVQRQTLIDGALATGTTTTPLDDSIPQNTEGTQVASLAITPTLKANVLSLSHAADYASSAAVQVIVSLFQDSTANALVAKCAKITAAGDDQVIPIAYDMIAATNASTTFKVRAGPSSAATITYNGSAGARLFGGVNTARLEIVERMA